MSKGDTVMDEQKRRKDDSIGFIRRHIEVIVVIATVVIAFTTLQVKQAELSAKVCKNEIDIEELKPIKTDIKWIKESQQRIESRLDRWASGPKNDLDRWANK